MMDATLAVVIIGIAAFIFIGTLMMRAISRDIDADIEKCEKVKKWAKDKLDRRTNDGRKRN